MILSSGAILINLVLLLMHTGTGWVQFGLRYLFDIIPLLYLILAVAADYLPNWCFYAAFSYGIFVNLFGVLVFYNIFRI